MSQGEDRRWGGGGETHRMKRTNLSLKLREELDWEETVVSCVEPIIEQMGQSQRIERVKAEETRRRRLVDGITTSARRGKRGMFVRWRSCGLIFRGLDQFDLSDLAPVALVHPRLVLQETAPQVPLLIGRERRKGHQRITWTLLIDPKGRVNLSHQKIVRVSTQHRTEVEWMIRLREGEEELEEQLQHDGRPLVVVHVRWDDGKLLLLVRELTRGQRVVRMRKFDIGELLVDDWHVNGLEMQIQCRRGGGCWCRRGRGGWCEERRRRSWSRGRESYWRSREQRVVLWWRCDWTFAEGKPPSDALCECALATRRWLWEDYHGRHVKGIVLSLLLREWMRVDHRIDRLLKEIFSLEVADESELCACLNRARPARERGVR
jgi:hypothetical protein